MEIHENLWQVGGAGFTAPDDAAIYLIRCGQKAALIDAVYLERGDNDVTAASWYGTHLDPLPVDYKIRLTKETINIGSGEIIAHHCPGHSPGSLVFVTDLNSTRVLFGQDVHGPLDPSLLSNRKDYIKSLKFMLDFKADILCEGHFGVYQGKDEIEHFIRSFL